MSAHQHDPIIRYWEHVLERGRYTDQVTWVWRCPVCKATLRVPLALVPAEWRNADTPPNWVEDTFAALPPGEIMEARGVPPEVQEERH